MENMNQRIANAPITGIAGIAMLPCATPAADLRTSEVRSIVRVDAATAVAPEAKRVRVTAATTGMGHVGTERIVFGADYVPGSLTWSPPT